MLEQEKGTVSGSPSFSGATGTLAPSSREAMDSAVAALQSRKDAWVAVSPAERVVILDRLIADVAALAPDMVAAGVAAKGMVGDPLAEGEEWLLGPFVTLDNLTRLRHSLRDIAAGRTPRIPGHVRTMANGQVAARVFPQTAYDRIYLPGISAEILMAPGVTAAGLPGTQALAYFGGQQGGKVALVLGAGNVASIALTDTLYKLFVENQVVLLKTNPVNDYLGPLLERLFAALIGRGALQVAYGGAAEGAYLCAHPGVDEIHITGSDKTFDAIVFGSGAEGTRRKAERRPLLDKRVSGELGNVSPVIVVPGPWSDGDIAFQADNLASALVRNSGFNCITPRVIVSHAEWSGRAALLAALRQVLAALPARNAYYPGAAERHQLFLAAHPDAELLGSASPGALPWTLIAGLDPQDSDEVCFSTEAFCSLISETAISARSVAEYVDKAVEFANAGLWGSLAASILVHPASMRDRAVGVAVRRAVGRLRYGTVTINADAAVGFALTAASWGAYPGHPLHDIRSGVGVVHNSLMFSRAQKSIVRAPFHAWPTPPWFVSRRHLTAAVVRRLVAAQADPSPLHIPGIVRATLGL